MALAGPTQATSPTTVHNPKNERGTRVINIGETERLISIAIGIPVTIFGLTRGILNGLLPTLLGGGLIFRGVTGHSFLYQVLGVSTVEHTPAITTLPLRRTHKTVVERISRLVGMNVIFDYNSGKPTPLLSAKSLVWRDLQIASVTRRWITAVTFLDGSVALSVWACPSSQLFFVKIKSPCRYCGQPLISSIRNSCIAGLGRKLWSWR